MKKEHERNLLLLRLTTVCSVIEVWEKNKITTTSLPPSLFFLLFLSQTWLSSVKTNTKWRRLNCKIVDRGVKKRHHHGQPPHLHPHTHQSSEHQMHPLKTSSSIHESSCSSSYTSHITCCMNLVCKTVVEEVGTSDEASIQTGPWNDNWWHVIRKPWF